MVKKLGMEIEDLFYAIAVTGALKEKGSPIGAFCSPGISSHKLRMRKKI